MHKKIYLKTNEEINVINLTNEVENFIAKSALTDGAVIVHVTGSTASVSTIEYEPGLIKDIKKNLLKLFPKDNHYHHHETWNDGNGYSHIMATIMKPSIIVPILKGRLALGTWQQIILMDFDNKPRNREVLLKIIPG